MHCIVWCIVGCVRVNLNVLRVFVIVDFFTTISIFVCVFLNLNVWQFECGIYVCMYVSLYVRIYA